MDFDFSTILSHLLHLLLAYGFALPIGFERERDSRSAGIRTFPLVAVAACGYMIIGTTMLLGPEPQSRVMYGIITGMGFIGGGAILKNQNMVTGTATAASLWNTGAIGMAVAWKRYEIALILSTLNFLTLRYATQLKSKVVDTKDQTSDDSIYPP
ncbi:MgtC/SapB family protein [Chitinispirillales bacterium ANBcel5]|uniref:MgtC/SapB family protein n=1 Tax=Cellulosispirillum alkaliphilum TaxID=3039283 RepID=UPI002A55C71C|nr:MgtC/SapB family protein [Chitinispirillales bacterium ANBcel5]